MRHITLLLIALTLVVASTDARTIRGAVLSGADSTAVSGAVCRLMADGKVISGVNTDTRGAFALKTADTSASNLEIAMTVFSSTAVIVPPGSRDIDLGTIYLDEGIMLDGLTVTGNSAVNYMGRTIVYPSTADIKASATSVGLFQKLPLPGLEANPINRNLSVDGGTPMILIDGVPSTMDDVNALKPGDITKIEYSRITPARYADRGVNGLVSITLRRRSDGGQVYVWGRSALNTVFVNANVKASYHQGPSQFTILYSPSWRNYQDVFDNTTESYIGTYCRGNLEQHDRNPFSYHYHPVLLKYDYTPTARTLFTVTFNATPNYNKSRSFAHTVD